MKLIFWNKWLLQHLRGGGERVAYLKFRVKIQFKLLVVLWEGEREGGKDWV